MEAIYNDEGKFVVTILPDETEIVFTYMQLFIEEEMEKGHRVPKFGKDFFANLVGSKKLTQVAFGFKDIGFAVDFLEEILKKSSEEDDVSELKGLVYEMKYVYGYSIH